MRRAAPLALIGALTLGACSTPIPRVGAVSGTYRAEVQDPGGPARPASATVEENGHGVRILLTQDGAERTFVGTASLSRASTLEVNTTRGEAGRCGGSVLPAEALTLRFEAGGTPVAAGRLFRLTCQDGMPREDYGTASEVRLFRP